MKANALSRPDRIGLKVATVLFWRVRLAHGLGLASSWRSGAALGPTPDGVRDLHPGGLGYRGTGGLGHHPGDRGGCPRGSGSARVDGFRADLHLPASPRDLCHRLACGLEFCSLRRAPLRRSLSQELATLESTRFLILATLATLGVFAIIPLLGAAAWSLYGCSGKISGALCA